jgi:restriction system protein
MRYEPTRSTGDGIPAWHEFIIQVLRALEDGRILTRRELDSKTLDVAGITPEQRGVQMRSGGQLVLNRIGWAMSALTRAKAVGKPERGHYVITPVGTDLLSGFPEIITEKDLMALPAWNEYVPTPRGEKLDSTNEIDLSEQDPAEAIEISVEKIKTDVAGELLSRLRAGDPEFFERAVIELLKAMNYGGSSQDVQHLGRSGDGGVDGVINQDALGLHRVFIQSKRYAENSTVGRPDLQNFVGALADKGATQGAFVTTSKFSEPAIEYAEKVSAQTRIVLIDGSRLAELMLEYKVGVQVKETFEILEVDEDFFD